MGNGIPLMVANTILISLNGMFDQQNMPTMQKRYQNAKALYPDFLSFTDDQTDRHNWRTRTLRFAGWVLTADVNFISMKHAYPAKNFAKWLRWLTWLQVMPPANGTVQVNGNASNEAPAKAILDTLKMALEDLAQTGIQFTWTEAQAPMISVNQVSGNYAINVTSMKEADVPPGVGEGDEDDGI